MKKCQLALLRLSFIAVLLGLAPFANAACDLKIASAGPCLADGSPGTPKAGDGYGLKVTLDITGTPSAHFRILVTMANQSYSIPNISVGQGNGYSWYVEWPLDLDESIPWSVTVDPDNVSGDTNLANNVASGTFTPTPPPTATDLFDPVVWNGSEGFTLVFAPSSGTIDYLYILFGVPTTHGAQTALSVTGPVGAEYIVTNPYDVPVNQLSWSNTPAATFQSSDSFTVMLCKTRVNPTILRTNTWASLSGMSTNWTQWIAPDTRCQSTSPIVAAFVTSNLPPDYLTSMTPYDAARTLHMAVQRTLHYEEPPPEIDAIGVLTDGYIADCGGYSALLTASLRHIGIPARCISGFRAGEQIPHVRTEFHLPGTEWIIADATDGNTNDPTGTFAYDFGITSDGNEYVAVDTGDSHILPYYDFEFIQVPNDYGSWNATFESYTPTYALTSVPGLAVLASPSDAGTCTGAGAYTANASVQIMATANPGWAFTGWSDGSSQNPRNVSVPAAGTNYIASFVEEVPEINLTGTLAFGNVTTGTTANLSFDITNPGGTNLLVTSISYPAGFSGAWSGTIPPSGSQSVPVTFAPTALGGASGTITVNSDAASGVNTIFASGTGVGPLPSNIATPVITPDGGVVDDSAKVTMKSTTAKSVVHYTLDGSTPSLESPICKSSITITNSLTLNAIAFLGTNTPSAMATAVFTISRPSITPAVLADGTVGTVFTPVDLVATGGKAPYKWKVVGAVKLPSGLKLASTGAITGTPKVAGAATFTVEVTDAGKGTAEQSFSLTVNQ